MDGFRFEAVLVVAVVEVVVDVVVVAVVVAAAVAFPDFVCVCAVALSCLGL